MFLIRNGLWLVTTYGGKAASVIIGALLTVVLFLASIAASQAATGTAVSAVYFGQPITVRETYSRVKGLIFRVVLVMIGMGIGITIGLLLLIVPGIILALMWALTIPVVVRAVTHEYRPRLRWESHKPCQGPRWQFCAPRQER